VQKVMAGYDERFRSSSMIMTLLSSSFPSIAVLTDALELRDS
jgi:hypothetical protein